MARPRRRDQQHGNRRAARRDPRQGPVRKRLSRCRSACRGLGKGAQHHRRRPPDGHGLDARSADARIRLEVRRLGPRLGRNDRGPHHRMRCSILRRQLPVRLADRSPTWRTSASRSSKPRRTAASSSPNTKAPAAASISSRSKSSSSTRWATRTPTSRPMSSPISHRSNSQTPARTGQSLRHQRPSKNRFLQSLDRLLRRLEIRRHTRLFLARRLRKSQAADKILRATTRQSRPKIRHRS